MRFWRHRRHRVRGLAGRVHHERIDDMLKINGALVEPAEAEQVLRAAVCIRAGVARGLESLFERICALDDAILV